MIKPTVYTGTFIHTPSLGGLEVLANKAVGVDKDGVIRFIEDCPEANDDKIAFIETIFQHMGLQVEDFGEWEYVRDTHIHASQHPNAGVFGKSTLLSWLHTYTFPLESSLSDPNKAQKVYNSAVSRTLSHGTTTAAYFATIHVESTNRLADICLRKGQRAFIGRCSMDSDVNASYYKDRSADSAIKDTLSTISYINIIDPHRSLITPILTPRFAPSCTPALLSKLGHLAKTTSLPVQTHISENTAEIALVKEVFPSQSAYAEVYDHHNLLTSKTVLAHGIHLSPSERALIKQKGSKISHCPVSNTSLSSGLCPVRELLDEGIDVGLGTDVSGGYSSSILTAAREAGMISRVLAGLYPDDPVPGDGEVKGREDGEVDVGGKRVLEKDRRKLTPEECLYLATRGGAKCLGLEGKVGNFKVGMEWDAQLVEVEKVDEYHDDDADGGIGGDVKRNTKRNDTGLVELWGNEGWNDKIAKWVFCGDDRNTKKVYVKGRLVHERP